MKKLAKIILFAGMLGALLCGGALAAEMSPAHTGSCGADGSNVTWAFDANSGTLTITGNGAMNDFVPVDNPETPDINEDTRPWNAYNEKITSVSVEQGVTYVGTKAFGYLPNLNTATLPRKAVLGSDVFRNCESLESLVLPSDLKVLPNRTVVWCESLKSLKIPNSVTAIGVDVLHGCTALESVTLPDSITTIPSAIFWGCENLQSIDIPESVTEISYHAFDGCSLITEVELPQHLETIGASAFANTGLTSIDIPDSVNKIDQSAFYHCSNLQAVKIGSNISDIPYHAFENCTAMESFDMSVLTTPITMGSGACNFRTIGDTSILYLNHEGMKPIENTAYYNTKAQMALAITNGGAFPTGTAFTANELASPVKNGEIFDGWYTESTFETKVTTAEGRNSYYAKWLSAQDISFATVANTLVVGDTLDIIVNGGIEGNEVTYTVDNASIATAEDTILKAHKPGIVTITATKTGDGISFGDTAISKTIFIVNSKDDVVDITINSNGATLGDSTFEVLSITSISKTETSHLENECPRNYYTESEHGATFNLYALVNGLIIENANFSNEIIVTIPYDVKYDKRYKILHKKSNGSVEILNTEANAEERTLTFNVRSLSPFMVVSKAAEYTAPTYVDLDITISGAGSIFPNGGSDGTISVAEGSKRTFTVDGDIDEIYYNGKRIDVVDGKFTVTIQKDSELEVVFADTEIESPFTDLDADDNAFAAVYALYENGIINGMTADTFGGGIAINRAMITTMLHRVEGLPVSGIADFADVFAGMWYTNGVNWATTEQVVDGYPDGTFKPEQIITNQEMCKILRDYAMYCGVSVDATLTAEGVANWASNAVAWAQEIDMFTGNATDVVTRAQACEMIVAVLDLIAE